jgi:hypothetical protein
MFSSGRLKSHWKNPHKIESRHPEIRIPIGGIKIPESNERIPSLKPGVLKNRKIRENRFSYVTVTISNYVACKNNHGRLLIHITSWNELVTIEWAFKNGLIIN